uniref:Uncharacterized protein n=1 Tax=Anguilla anguilla TaxID=7936 RepID=A0A0E9QHP7_ANGAN
MCLRLACLAGLPSSFAVALQEESQ